MNSFIITLFSTIVFLSNTGLAGLSATDTRKLCTELGLTPESIAVLGLNGTDTQTAFNRISDEEVAFFQLREFQSQLHLAMSSLKEAQHMIRFLEDEIEVNQKQTEIDDLNQSIDSTKNQISALIDHLRVVFLPSDVNTQTISLVCEPSGLSQLVPPEFRVIPLLEDDYTLIYAALLEEKQAMANGTIHDLDIESQLTLSRYRNLPAVQSARSNLFRNLDAVRGVFYN